MIKHWTIRLMCMALAAITLSGCVIVPARHAYRPVYYYR
jgi:hypothetical protein